MDLSGQHDHARIPLGAPADITHLVAKVPDDIRAALSPPQVAHLVCMLRSKEHVVTYQISTNFLGEQIYLAVFAGPEDRAPARLRRERQYRSFLSLLVKFGLGSIVPAILTVAGLMAGVLVLYLVKSWLHIDLLEGHSLLHDLVFGS